MHPTQTDSHQHIAISDLSVILVEPSKMQAQLIRKIMKDVGVGSTQVFGKGAEALDEIRLASPDLVVSAMYLPDMTGTEMVQAMRRDPLMETVPFMLVSSESHEELLDPVRQAGVIAILPKPFEARDLQRALYSALDFINPDKELVEEDAIIEARVLVVDDSLTARNHIKRVLRGAGIEQIEEACDGLEAVDMLKDNYYDLLVSDYNMPDMDGQALTTYVREKSSQSSVPILMVTSESNEGKLSAVRQSGVSAICDKPFESQTVKHLLRRLLVEEANG